MFGLHAADDMLNYISNMHAIYILYVVVHHLFPNGRRVGGDEIQITQPRLPLGNQMRAICIICTETQIMYLFNIFSTYLNMFQGF